ncbi:Isochorismate synthase dhbC [Arcanobacterium haemolyticum]|uniref:isochorismate synthase n=1 Tax=Arcanobacterium haemolyticum TaxID=28264 RepID=UPI000D8163A1|nr:isochorismate synthase [Arcanobacterium haemolyticum]SPT74932.1 Isochorismate synthase dhbC [Arcanobacterium haemolyticum]
MFTIPHLRAQTTRLPGTPELTRLLPASRGQIAWLQDGRGFVAAGQAARFDRGADDEGGASAGAGSAGSGARENGRRFAIASQWWNAVKDAAEIRDDVRVAGSGLVAFGSFSFSPVSTAGSSLIVPQVIVGLGGAAGTEAFLTLIGPDDQDVFETLTPEARALLDAVLVGTEPEHAPIGAVRAEPTIDAAGYRERVERILAQINAGSVEKVVFARQLDIVAESPIDERSLLHHLAEQYPQCWVFGIDGLVGATPEMLAETDSGTVVTRVLAGTFPRGVYADDTLLSSPKNLHEHAVAVDSAVESLSKIGTVEAGEPFVLHLPNVSHLATDIRTTLGYSADVLQVAGALHPTAALGGQPREMALDLIAELEDDRDRFGAPVGWIGSDGSGQWCVALRCVRIDGDLSARAWAGGGIMGDSQPDEEFTETEAKFAPILGAFGA